MSYVSEKGHHTCICGIVTFFIRLRQYMVQNHPIVLHEKGRYDKVITAEYGYDFVCVHRMITQLIPRFSASVIGAEAHAVNALLRARIGFMSADRNMIECAVVCTICMICTLFHSTTNCFVLHIGIPPSKLYEKYVKNLYPIYSLCPKNSNSSLTKIV